MSNKLNGWCARRAENDLLAQWDERIKKTARRSAAKARCSPDQSEDAQQEYREAVLKAARRGLRSPPQIQRVISNAAKRHHRDERRGLRSRAGRTESLDALTEINRYPDSQFVFPDLEHEENLDRIRLALNSLPAELQAVYDKVYVQELSTRQAAAALSISRTTLYTRHERLKTVVRSFVRDHAGASSAA